MHLIILIRFAAGGGSIRFSGQKCFAILRFSRQARIFCDEKAARIFGPVNERETKREPFKSFGVDKMASAACVPRGFPGGSGTRASAPTPSRCSAASWTAGRRMGGRLPRREENQRKGAAFPLIFVGVRFCYGAAVPMKLSYSWESSISAPPIPQAACGDKGQGAVNPGAPRPGGRCSRPTGGCSRRSRRRCPGPPRRRRGRGPGGSAGSRGQTPPCGCRRR